MVKRLVWLHELAPRLPREARVRREPLRHRNQLRQLRNLPVRRVGADHLQRQHSGRKGLHLEKIGAEIFQRKELLVCQKLRRPELLDPGLQRRQPNKPIRDGLQLYVISESKGHWVYQSWIDQGENANGDRKPCQADRCAPFGDPAAKCRIEIEQGRALGHGCILAHDGIRLNLDRRRSFTSPRVRGEVGTHR